jgi:hypothetical protein
VGERADAHDHIDLVPAAERHKGAQVAVAFPAKAALLLLVVDPEDIGGEDVDAAQLDLDDLGLPLAGGAARVVELAADAKEGLAVQLHIVVGEADAVAAGVDAALHQRHGVDMLGGPAQLDRVAGHWVNPLPISIADCRLRRRGVQMIA